LDFLKGVAIVTVVLGHTFQRATDDFGNYAPFRELYSFHMPMFMFVAGMAMSAGMFASLQPNSSHLGEYIGRRALRLLVPFIIWAAIKFFLVRPMDSVLAWYSAVIHSPDNALWFLVALFEISVVVAVCATCARIALRRFGRENSPTTELIAFAGCIALGSTLFWLFRYFVPSLGLAIYYMKYVALGILYHRLFPSGPNPVFSIAALVVFAALSPFWVWNGPPALDWHPSIIDGRVVTAVFDFVVGLSGTLAFVEAVRIVARFAPSVVLISIAFCGRRTLDIYALHYYFLACAPPVVGPILASLATSFVCRQVPFGSLILFGDAKYRPLWLRALSARRARRALP
jgi:fucose 4-O-acetylase-like acetyltransferase